RFGAPAQNNFTGSDPGQSVLNQHFHQQSGDTLTLAIHSTAPVGSPAVRARVTSALTPFTRAPHVTSVTSPYHAAAQISADRHTAFAVVRLQADGVPGSELLPGGRRCRPGRGPLRGADGRGGRAGGRHCAADRVRLLA